MKLRYGIKTYGLKMAGLSKGSFIAIGIFDGVHKGHRKIITQMVTAARSRRAKSVVVTFDPHPLAILRPSLRPPTVMSLEHRVALIERLGVQRVIVISFTKKFSRMLPEVFVERVLVKKLGAKELFVGENFHFGKGGSGNVFKLTTLGRQFGFLVHVVAPLRVKGRIVSSTLIRTLIEKGDLGAASSLLGRYVSILGTVVHGSRRGRLLGFPTANLDPHHEALPPSGVYAAKIRLREGVFDGVLNIGRRPTFSGQTEPTIEVHIERFNKKIYGRTIETFFLRRLRAERTFRKKEDLILQIRKDELRALKTLRHPFFLP